MLFGKYVNAYNTVISVLSAITVGARRVKPK